LDGHSKVVRNISVPRLRIVGFGDWSLKMEVYAYVDARELPVFVVIQQELTIAIIDRVRQSGAEFAFPSQTMYLSRDALEIGGGRAGDLRESFNL
jgi:MscS family membrane protein